MRATVFGAGNIGRGLVGFVLGRGAYDLTFVDVNEHLVSAIQRSGGYQVTTDRGHTYDVDVAAAVSARDEDAVVAAVASSDVVATAVGPAVLAVVAGPIARGLRETQVANVNVLACENVHPNSTLLRRRVAEHDGDAADRAGFPDVVVDRIVPGDPPLGEDPPLDLDVEHHFEFLVEARTWRGPQPGSAALDFVDDLEPYKKRKLWMVNGLHAAAAWLGLQSGHEYIDAAVADGAIRVNLDRMASTMVEVLAAQYAFLEAEELRHYAHTSLSRFANGAIRDRCARVARNPLIKLGADERILGSAVAAEQAGLDVSGHAAAICAALALRPGMAEGAEEFLQLIEQDGWRQYMESIGVTEDGPLMDAIDDCAPAVGAQEDAGTVEVEILNPAGLHARPAAMVVERAKTLDADIVIRKGEKQANAKSIMSVLTLGASHGDVISVSAEGPDAAAAIEFIVGLMTTAEEGT